MGLSGIRTGEAGDAGGENTSSASLPCPFTLAFSEGIRFPLPLLEALAFDSSIFGGGVPFAFGGSFVLAFGGGFVSAVGGGFATAFEGGFAAAFGGGFALAFTGGPFHFGSVPLPFAVAMHGAFIFARTCFTFFFFFRMSLKSRLCTSFIDCDVFCNFFFFCNAGKGIGAETFNPLIFDMSRGGVFGIGVLRKCS